ncbi:MAG: hypothetical protein AAB575_00135, partial [Patescibacteria group bacterium]
MLDIFGLELNLDWSWIANLGNLPMYAIMWHFLVNGGWLMFIAVFLFGGWINFVFWRQKKFAMKQSFVMLAIDIPRDILQTPRAVENIFTAMAGAQTPLDWHEKYLKGQFQLGFSLEIISLEGFIQFLIRTPAHFRNLVEAAVYAQYPEAEITEVEDYTAEINTRFPSDEYNLWGADFVLIRDEHFPIRTYVEFQEELDKEFKDPMAAMLEVMSKIGPGEQLWFQLLISPAAIGWEKGGIKYANKVLGIEKNSKKNIFDYISDAPMQILTRIGDEVFAREASVVDDKKKEKMNMMYLDPIKKKEVEGVLRKIDKNCYKSKLRIVYYAKREVFKKALAVSGMVGSIKQFGSTALNGFKPGKNKTQAKLMFINSRMATKQNAILKNYKGRNADTVTGPYLLSVEEIATLYHFPFIEIRAPLVKKIAAKKTRAPIGLPVEELIPFKEEEEAKEKPEKIVPVVDYDNDYFEKRFAIDKSGESDKVRKATILKQINKAQKHTSTKAITSEPIEDETPITMVEPRKTVRGEQPLDATRGDIEKNGAVPGNLPFVE